MFRDSKGIHKILMERVMNMVRGSLWSLALFCIWGCGQRASESPTIASEQPSETERLYAFFETTFEEELSRSPQLATYLGRSENKDKWDTYTDQAALEDIHRSQSKLAEMRESFDFKLLTPEAQLSYRLFEKRCELRKASEPWIYHTYPVNQMYGLQADIPAFLINAHTIATVEDAEAYISRLQGLERVVQDIIQQMQIRNTKGITPPKFVFPYVYDDIDNLLTGRPFDDSETNSALLKDFQAKIADLKLTETQHADLIKRASKALIEVVAPAFRALRVATQEQETIANDDDGIWKLPDGEAYYAYLLKQHTSTDMSAEDIHQLGLREVARIHDELRGLMKQIGVDGDLKDFFRYMEDDRFFYQGTDEGRQAYFQKTEAFVDRMRLKLDDYFLTQPKAEMIVKAVEPFREKSATIAFYDAPAMDGSRPGIYYTNLYDMSSRPIYNIETIAYHEALPGHHMQVAIAQELEDVPMFRRLDDYTAYAEGWGLYAEWLGKDMGFFEDPYSDFGRLNQELWRAVRLVVDTGIHAKKWTRQQVIDYHQATTPNPLLEIVKETERYIVLPGQATSYKVGMIKIQELRTKAEKELGPNFDIRQFHDSILTSGAVPLSIMEENVGKWVMGKSRD